MSIGSMPVFFITISNLADHRRAMGMKRAGVVWPNALLSPFSLGKKLDPIFINPMSTTGRMGVVCLICTPCQILKVVPEVSGLVGKSINRKRPSEFKVFHVKFQGIFLEFIKKKRSSGTS